MSAEQKAAKRKKGERRSRTNFHPSFCRGIWGKGRYILPALGRGIVPGILLLGRRKRHPLNLRKKQTPFLFARGGKKDAVRPASFLPFSGITTKGGGGEGSSAVLSSEGGENQFLFSQQSDLVGKKETLKQPSLKEGEARRRSVCTPLPQWSTGGRGSSMSQRRKRVSHSFTSGERRGVLHLYRKGGRGKKRFFPLPILAAHKR